MRTKGKPCAPHASWRSTHTHLFDQEANIIVSQQKLKKRKRLLHASKIADAGLDVFEHEPAINPKLLELENVVSPPHMGSATIGGRLIPGTVNLIPVRKPDGR
jgi:glyoxylate reductase